MKKHVGVVAVIVHDRAQDAPKVNKILSEYGNMIVGRMGLPYHERNMYVITLIVDGSNDDIGALTGKLGHLKNVTVKCTLAKCS